MMLLFTVIGGVLPCWSMEKAISVIGEYLCDENYTISAAPPYEALGDFGDQYWKCKPEFMPTKLVYYDKRHTKLEIEWNTTDFKSLLGAYDDWPRNISVFTHGFVDSIERQESKKWMEKAREELTADNYGVILFDWSSGAQDFYNYAQAASNTRVAGRMLAYFLNNLKSDFSTNTKNKRSDIVYHLVGHSLGAHVCGQAGAYYKILSNETINRIDGLDPAGPLFLDQNAFDRYWDKQTMAKVELELNSTDEVELKQENYFQSFLDWLKSIGINSNTNGSISDQPEDAIYLEAMTQTITMQKKPVPDQSRLDRDDADFVMIIHTNAFGFGGFENIGDVDFWPNGGILQKECLTLFGVLDDENKISKCSHRYSHDLWAESVKINSSSMFSYSCDNRTNVYEYSNATCLLNSSAAFGFQATRDLMGSIFYVDTSEQAARPSNLLENSLRLTFALMILLIVVLVFLWIRNCQPDGRFRNGRLCQCLLRRSRTYDSPDQVDVPLNQDCVDHVISVASTNENRFWKPIKGICSKQ